MTVLFVFGLGILAVLLNKYIRKYFSVLLGLSIVLSMVAFMVDNEFFAFITGGFLGLAFFIVVMFAGAFMNGSLLNKKLRCVRKEYSILGFIFLIPHTLIFLIYYLEGTLNVEWLGIIAYIIMIPLFVTSFGNVKKKMDIHNWITLQRFSYFAYLGIYLHLMLVSSDDHKVVYTVIFMSYSLLKVSSSLREKDRFKSVVSGIGVLSVLITFFFTSPITIDSNVIEENTIIVDNIENIVEDIVGDGDEFIDGEYTGYSTGYRGLAVEVVVTVSGGEIVDIDIVEYGGTSPERGMNFEEAASEVADDIITAQSTDVDTISGASYTTSGIISAVEDALGIN